MIIRYRSSLAILCLTVVLVFAGWSLWMILAIRNLCRCSDYDVDRLPGYLCYRSPEYNISWLGVDGASAPALSFKPVVHMHQKIMGSSKQAKIEKELTSWYASEDRKKGLHKIRHFRWRAFGDNWLFADDPEVATMDDNKKSPLVLRQIGMFVVDDSYTWVGLDDILHRNSSSYPQKPDALLPRVAKRLDWKD